MSLNSVIDRAVSDPEFAKRLSRDFVGASREAGLEVSASEIKAFVGMHGASDEEAVQALQARISHTGLLTGVDFAGDDEVPTTPAAAGSPDLSAATTVPATAHLNHQTGPADDLKAPAAEAKVEAPEKPEVVETKAEAEVEETDGDNHNVQDEHGNAEHGNVQTGKHD